MRSYQSLDALTFSVHCRLTIVKRLAHHEHLSITDLPDLSDK
jgi:hypothetical protein